MLGNLWKSQVAKSNLGLPQGPGTYSDLGLTATWDFTWDLQSFILSRFELYFYF